MSYKLNITLKSDLCAGSGDGFSSGIDQDVCYDADGVPYIPARRIKGCLRETAQDIGMDPRDVGILFGVSGSSQGGAISIADARLVDPDREGSRLATLDRYTYTRAQTKIGRETGSAQDESLRYVRVIKHYRDDGEELTFVSKVTLDEGRLGGLRRSDVRRHLMRCAKGLRNIGMGRNRGLGAVQCFLDRSGEEEGKGRVGIEADARMLHELARGNMVAISYAVKLDAPLMLPQANGERSHPCIPGTSVMGLFASRLGGRADFDELLFGGKLRFSSLYPTDGDGQFANRCLPAASFVAKVKAGVRDGSYCRADSFEPVTPESIKPLKDGFMSPATWRPVDVKSEIVYHHSKGRDGTLYTQQCLSAGQVFAGFVECPKDIAPIVRDVLSQGGLSFGRSKSAQYARCELVPCERDHAGIGGKLDVRQGKKYALLLESDAMLVTDASSVASLPDLETALRKAGALGAWYERCDADDQGAGHAATSLSVRTIGGYNAKWNQKKPHVRVFDAGGCLVFEAACSARDVEAVRTFGLRQAEGYGRVRLIDLDSVSPRNAPSPDGLQTGNTEAEQKRLAAVGYADTKWGEILSKSWMTSSFLGRLAMMVDESGVVDPVDFDSDLDARIASIKDDDKRNGAQGLVDGLRSELEQPWCASHQQLEKECLQLVLTMGKYLEKQGYGEGGAQ